MVVVGQPRGLWMRFLGRAIRSALALGVFLPVVTHFALNKYDLSDSFRP
jgi:hypothetical protein